MRRAYPILHIVLIAAMLVAAFAMAGEGAPFAWPSPRADLQGAITG